MSDLATKNCVPCAGGIVPLSGPELESVSAQLPGWGVIDGHHIEKTFSFDDFVGALAFVNEVGAVAEAQFHHPDIYLTWGKVQIQIWTHKIDGLTESDFVLGAKIDGLLDGK